jgi:demethylsterigmatocystin 6-O-methyltransferase
MPLQRTSTPLLELPKLLLNQEWRRVLSTGMLPKATFEDRNGLLACHSRFGSLLPCFQALPKFLAGNKYQPPVDNTHTAYQVAYHTELPAFVHAMGNLEKVHNFGLWMQANKASLPQWLDTVPFVELCANEDPEQPIFVDVGGSIGHQCVALKEKYPELPGRIIYQDLPVVIAHGLKIPGVEPMVYDFFQEQPIKGK